MEDNKPTKKYNEMVAPRIEDIRAWARDGVTEEEMSKRLGIAYSTFKEYKKRYSAILDAIKKGKERYDNEVVDALHKNTLGGIVVLKKPIKLKKRFFENGRLVREEEVIEIAEEETYIRPDTLAQMYWLNNRVPSKWKAKPTEDGEDTGIAPSINLIFKNCNGKDVNNA